MTRTDAALLAALADAARGLLLLSEQDAPFTPLRLVGSGPLTPARVLAALGLPPETPVEQLRLEQFFAPLTRVREGADAEAAAQAKRFAALQRLLAAELADPTVYRLGTVEVIVLLLGQAPSGSILGLRSTLIET
jgi:hypothetical protein